jgi:hypothetical protein
MKDPTTDLWTLPIIGSAGKTSQMDTHDEQDAFDNLHEELLERDNAAYSTAPSSLAVPSCASTQAYGTEKVRTRLHQHQCELVCTREKMQTRSHQHQCELVRTSTLRNRYTLPTPPPNDFGLFTHTVRTKASSIKFAHQSLCSPTILTILKAI